MAPNRCGSGLIFIVRDFSSISQAHQVGVQSKKAGKIISGAIITALPATPELPGQC
ncbi:MAG: hypothetical protein HRU05_15340 [Oceanospirillaceae bacterium]|nr:hypothetical protein [Oceanospirillaceae bacterium]